MKISKSAFPVKSTGPRHNRIGRGLLCRLTLLRRTGTSRILTGDSLRSTKGMRVVTGASFLMALLQSLCTAVLTISGIRVAIGLTALAAASGIYAPAKGFHQDAIRIPMLILAAGGALVNLAVLAWIWHLRGQASGQWRRREISTKERRSERLQVVLAIVTLVLVGLETWTHPMVHRTGPRPPTGSHVRRATPDVVG